MPWPNIKDQYTLIASVGGQKLLLQRIFKRSGKVERLGLLDTKLSILSLAQYFFV